MKNLSKKIRLYLISLIALVWFICFLVTIAFMACNNSFAFFSGCMTALPIVLCMKDFDSFIYHVQRAIEEYNCAEEL